MSSKANNAEEPEAISLTIERTVAGWKIPKATAPLVALGVAGFAAGLAQPKTIQSVFFLDPDRPGLHQFATFAFLHAGAAPFFWSLLFLGLVAPTLERRLGVAAFVAAFFASAAAAGGAYLVPASKGAGLGAIAGATFAVAGLIAAGQYETWRSRKDFKLSIPFAGRAVLPWWSGFLLLALFGVGLALMTLLELTRRFSWTFVAAHAAAAAAGAAAAFGASSIRPPVRERRQEKQDDARAHAALREELLKAEPPEPREPTVEPQPLATLDLGPQSQEIAAVLDRVFANDAVGAYTRFRAMTDKQPEACLEPEEQWRLCSLLIDHNHFRGAIECLKRLLKRHPYGHYSAQCQYQLRMIYHRTGQSRELAADYLLASLLPPPNDIPYEEARMRRPLSDADRRQAHATLADLGVTDLPDGRWVFKEGKAMRAEEAITQTAAPPRGAKRAAAEEKSPSPAPADHDKNLGQMALRKGSKKEEPAPPPPAPSVPSAADVFGNPEATGAFAPAEWENTGSGMHVSAPPPKPKPKRAAPMVDAAGEVALPGEGDARPSSDAAVRFPGEGDDDQPAELPPRSPKKAESISDILGKQDYSLAEPTPTPKPKRAIPTVPKPKSKDDIFKEMSDIWSKSLEPEPPAPEPARPAPHSAPPSFAPPPPAAAPVSPATPELFGKGTSSFELPPKFDSTGALKKAPPPPPEMIDKLPTGERSAIVFEGLQKETTAGSRSESMELLHERPAPRSEQSQTGRDEWAPFFTEDKGWGAKPSGGTEDPPRAKPFAPFAPPASDFARPPSRPDDFHDVPTRRAHEPAPSKPVQPVKPKAAPPAPPPKAKPYDSEITPSRQDWAPTKVLEAQSADKDFYFAGSGKDQTMVWSNFYSKDRSPVYNPEHRYSVIIAPATSILLKEVVEGLETLLKVNRDAAIHALKRRHGILSSDMLLHDAARLAQQFADRGQEVSLVEQDERLDFGDAQDVIRMKHDAKTGKFAGIQRSYERKWKELIGLGCGAVSLGAEGAPRDVIDLFFTEPGLHLRLWRSTLMAAPPIYAGGGDEQAFHSLACELARLAPHAIQTSGFIQWVQGKDFKPPVAFSGEIEYDNYTRWYLMAHYGRVKRYEAKAGARA